MRIFFLLPIFFLSSTCFSAFITDKSSLEKVKYDNNLLQIEKLIVDDIGYKSLKLSLMNNGFWALNDIEVDTLTHTNTVVSFDSTTNQLTIPFVKAKLGDSSILYFKDIIFKVDDKGVISLTQGQQINSVSGVITNQNSQPVKGVLVWADGIETFALTNELGEFVLLDLPIADINLKLHSQKFSTVQDFSINIVNGDNIFNRNISTITKKNIEITIQDARGNPLIGKKVQILSLDSLKILSKNVTDALGKILLSNISEKTLLISIEDGLSWESHNVSTLQNEIKIVSGIQDILKNKSIQKNSLPFTVNILDCIPNVLVMTDLILYPQNKSVYLEQLKTIVDKVRLSGAAYNPYLEGEENNPSVHYIFFITDIGTYRLVSIESGVIILAGSYSSVNSIEDILTTQIRTAIDNYYRPLIGLGVNAQLKRGQTIPLDYSVNTPFGRLFLHADKGSLGGDIVQELSDDWKQYNVILGKLSGVTFIDSVGNQDYTSQIEAYSACPYKANVAVSPLVGFSLEVTCDLAVKNEWISLNLAENFLGEHRAFSMRAYDNVTEVKVNLTDYCDVGCTTITFKGIDVNGMYKTVVLSNQTVSAPESFSSKNLGFSSITSVELFSFEAIINTIDVYKSTNTCVASSK